MELNGRKSVIEQKEISNSCKSCDRLTEIEGEMVCYQQGRITRLLPIEPNHSLIKLVCIGWQKK
ncbi:hypothetical protein [Shewanella aestuarii]|uniref:Uncharacterized protein n=1 Tax=Shewanella aestuarii TaxID=1028752 RepID=A0A6G9QLT0_9GAMM|nr:hypothetical protein [Shewanella aestuarii]QIR15544.1 hypothetical protein HBH39_14500 [Shewanella aestuarii]